MVINIIVAILVSAISNKILAAYTFKVIDGYVKDVVETAKESIRNAYSGKRAT
ncbi:MAG: hypothetical protein J6B68_04130 [Lachnospiraceae bacterium]|nr:hypothetical protein [Lachnospiraceae bacterium]